MTLITGSNENALLPSINKHSDFITISGMIQPKYFKQYVKPHKISPVQSGLFNRNILRGDIL